MRHLTRYCSLWKDDSTWMALVHATVVAACYVFWNFIVKIDNSYFFYEDILKFVPFLLPSHPLDWFNTWELGDPRPRLVTVLAEVANLHLRGWVSHLMLLPPAFGVGWLIYPLVCAVLYRATFLLSGKRFVGLSVALLWALSPAALDSLAEVYVPAKPLMNLWFALALLAAAHLQLAPGAPLRNPGIWGSPLRSALVLGTTIFLAFLTDETVAIILVCLPIICFRTFFAVRRDCGRAMLAWGALLAPIALFLIVALWAYPLVNRLAGQIPLDYIQMVLKGPVIAYKGAPAAGNISSPHLANWDSNFHPAETAYTMLTAHLLPFRRVGTFWTSGRAIKPSSWPQNEVELVVLFLCAFVSTLMLLPAERRLFVGALTLAAGCMVIIYAILLIPIGPAIVEVNYYGSLSSMLYALFIGFLFADIGSERWQRLLALLAVLVFGSLELRGYGETAFRNRTVFSNHIFVGFEGPEVTWDYNVLREIRRSVEAGEFTKTAELHPYPSRAFCYAFELEARRQLKMGKKIDFVPGENVGSLYGELLRLHLASLGPTGTVPTGEAAEPVLADRLAQGAQELSDGDLRDLVAGKTWHGENGEFSFTRSYSNGEFVERYWIPTVMRVWRQHGVVEIIGHGVLRLKGASSGVQELHVLRDKKFYYGYDRNGGFLVRFQMIPPVSL